MQDGIDREMNKTTARVVFWSLVLGVIVCAGMIVVSGFRARADESRPLPGCQEALECSIR